MNRTNWFDALVLVMVVITVLMTPTQMALSIKAGPEHTVSDIGLSLADIMMALTALVWGIGVLARGQLRQLRWPPLAAWVFLALCIPSVLWTGSMTRGAAKLLEYVEFFFVAYMVFVNTLTTRRARIAVLVALFVGLGVNTLFAFRTLLTASPDQFNPVKVAGLLGNRNLFGMYLCLLLPVAGALALFAKQVWLKVIGAILALAPLAVVLAGGPFLGLLLGLGALVATWKFRTLPIYLAAVLLLVLLLLPALPCNNTQLLTKSVAMYDQDGKDEGHRVLKRYLEWQAALTSLDPMQPPYRTKLDYPKKVLFGHGIGLYEKEIHDFWGALPSPDEDIMEKDTQNQYLVLAISSGFPAALAFIWLLASYANGARLSLLTSADRLDRIIAMGLICALIAGALAANFTLVIVRGVGLVLVCLAAMTAARKSPTQ